MTTPRRNLLDWAEQGRIAPEALRRALDLARVLPDRTAWRRFLDHLLLWLGVAMLGAGLVFFLAANWNDLGRHAKFALAEVLLAAALAVVAVRGLDRAAGRAALFAAAIAAGALLALIGQTYQTGADTFELFAVWAFAILPWALVGRMPALWLLWLVLANLALTFYFRAFPVPLEGVAGLALGTAFGPERALWSLFALNTGAAILWEGSAATGIVWLRARWALRVVLTASGALATVLAVTWFVDAGPSRGRSGWNIMAWLAWTVAAYAVYRRRIRDVYVLAGGVLSVIVVVAALLGKQILSRHGDAGGLLFIGLVVIGLSAAGGLWLRRIANEERAA